MSKKKKEDVGAKKAPLFSDALPLSLEKAVYGRIFIFVPSLRFVALKFVGSMTIILLLSVCKQTSLSARV